MHVKWILIACVEYTNNSNYIHCSDRIAQTIKMTIANDMYFSL